MQRSGKYRHTYRKNRPFERALILSAAAAAGLGLSCWAAANTELDVPTSSTDLTTVGSTSTSDLTFTNSTYTGTTFTINGATALNAGTLNDLDATQSLIIQNGTASTAAALTLNGGSNTVSGSAGDLLYVATNGNLTIQNGPGTLGLSLAASGNFDIAGTATINSIISGAGGITKTGAGTLTLGTSTNTFSGGLVISAGTVAVDSNLRLGGTSGTAGAVTLNGGTLRMNLGGTGQTNTHVMTVGAGGGTIVVSSTSGTPTYILGNAGNLTGAGNLTISGTGTLVSAGGTGASVFVMANTNAGYSGNMSVTNGGVIEYANATAIPVTSSFTVENLGMLSVNNVTIAQAVTVNSGGTLAFQNTGNGVFSNTITLNGNGTVRLQNWWNATVQNGLISGQITGNGGLTVNSGGGSGATLTLSNSNNYGGGTTIASSTLSLGNGGTTGGLSAIGAIVDNGTLSFNRSNAMGQGTDFSSAAITGTGGIVQTGSGTTTLNVANTFAGSTAFTAGTISVADATYLGGATGNNSLIFNGGTLQVTGTTMTGFGSHTVTYNASKTIGFDINNAANNFSAGTTAFVSTDTLLKTGAGTLTLGAASNTVKTVQLNQGTLDIGANNLAISNTGGTTINNASTTNNVVINATGGGKIVLSQNNATDGPDIGAANGGTLTINAAITGTSAFENWTGTANGTGVTVLTGANDYTGNTIINAGVLSVSNIGNSGATTSNLGQGSTIQISSAAGNNQNSTLKYTGTGETTNRVINFWLNGTNTGGIIDQSGASGALVFSSNMTVTGTGTKTLTLQGSTAGTGEFAGNIVNGSSTVSLIKAGTGTWKLSGANTYTGTTSVTGGFLNLANSLALQSTLLATGGSGIVFDSSVATHAFTFGSLAGSADLALTDNAANAVALTLAGSTSSDYSGGLSGSGSLTKSGAGTQTLSGSNLHTGGTNLNGGTLALGSSGALGTIGSIAFGGGTLQYSSANTTDYSARIASGTSSGAVAIDTNGQTVTFGTGLTSSQSGGLNKLGTGSLILSGSNSYSGATVVNAGKLQFNDATAMSGSSVITLNNGGTLSLNSDAVNPTFTPSGNLQLSGATNTINVGNISTGTNQTITLAGTTAVSTAGNTLNVTASNGYQLTLGAISLPGNGTHIFSAASGATLNIGTMTTTGGTYDVIQFAGAGDINVTGAMTNPSRNRSLALVFNQTGSVTLSGSNNLRDNNNASDNSNTYVNLNSGTVNFNNANAIGSTSTGFTFNINGGTINNTTATPITLTSNGSTFSTSINGDFAFGGTRDLSLGTNAVSLGTSAGATRTITTNGTATLTLGGVISNGTNATTPTVSLTKAGAGTLQLTGANLYTGGTSVTAGVLKTGATGRVGTGNVVVANNGTVLDLGNATSISDSASLVLGSGTTLTLRFSNATESVASVQFGSQVFSLPTVFSSSDLHGVDSSYFSFVGSNATLTVVPEPSSLALLGLGAAGLMGRRRRRAK